MGLNRRAAALMRRRTRTVGAGLLGIGFALFGVVIAPTDRLI